ncbi:MAG: LON peptidase substrate-binding domain-containing protein, partial [Candidatus Acidiferrum sp.]
MFTREKQDLKRVPMMPVRDMVIFPQQMTPFIVGREASVRALEEALAGDKKIFLSTQHDASVDDPKPEEIYAVGTLANIVQSVKLPDGNIKVLVEGVERARALSIASEEGFFRATVRLLGARVEDSPQVKQIVEKVTSLYEQFIKLSQSLNYDTMIAAARGDDPARLSDTISANLQLPVDEKQDLLETVDPIERLNRISDILEIELEKLNVDRNINTRVKRQMERAQKEYYLNEKLKAIQKELGRGEANEIEQLKKKIETSGMPEGPQEKALQELKRLEMMPPMSAESTV